MFSQLTGELVMPLYYFVFDTPGGDIVEELNFATDEEAEQHARAKAGPGTVVNIMNMSEGELVATIRKKK